MPAAPFAFEPRGKRPPSASSWRLRFWSIRHAGFLQRAYDAIQRLVVAAAPLLRRLGYERLEAPFAFAERHIKGALFDCRMCGECILSSTGMSCPMNCPKSLRNGPCGGVRADGNCEVRPEMKCVWVEAWRGSQRIEGGVEALRTLQFAVDHRLQGRSSWLRVAREKAAPP